MPVTDLIVTSPPTGQLYSSGNVEEIIPQDRYVGHDVKASSVVGYAQSPRAQNLSEDSVSAQLGPLERWRYLAKYDRVEFIVWLLALFGGAIMLILAAENLIF